jgi:hypothetical protein
MLQSLYNEDQAKQLVTFLNTLVEGDREGLTKLFFLHVPCNDFISSHPTIQVGNDGVGVLGVLNGLFGVNEYNYGCIVMHINDKTKLIEKFAFDPTLGGTVPASPSDTVSPTISEEK